MGAVSILLGNRGYSTEANDLLSIARNDLAIIAKLFPESEAVERQAPSEKDPPHPDPHSPAPAESAVPENDAGHSPTDASRSP